MRHFFEIFVSTVNVWETPIGIEKIGHSTLLIASIGWLVVSAYCFSRIHNYYLQAYTFVEWTYSFYLLNYITKINLPS